MDELKKLYEENSSFKYFVDKHIHSKNGTITIEEALTHKIVQLYAEFLQKN